MKKLVFMVLFTALSLKMAFAGGVAVGNGGDVIMCSTEVTFKSLDYALTVNNFGNNIEIPSPQSYRESLTRIESLLKLSSPT